MRQHTLDRLIDAGYQAACSEDLGQAAGIFRQALALDPDNERAWGMLGIVEYRAKRYEEALQAFSRAVEIEPDSGTAHADRARALLALNRNSEAAVEYQQALGLLDAFLEDVPDAPSTLACRASVLKALGRADEALRDYQAAVQLKPKAQWLEAQGDLYSEFGNRSEAERSYHQALLLDPDRFDVLVALAKLISETKPTEAEPLLRRALELEPNSVAAMNDLGYFVLKAERFSEAEKIFKDALRIREDEFIRGQLAFVYFKQGRLSEAEAEHLKNCSQHPDSALALRLLGSYFSDVGKLEDAERVFRRAISIDPRRPESALRLATFLKQTGNFVEASQWARKAVELDPQNTEAIHLLEDLES